METRGLVWQLTLVICNGRVCIHDEKIFLVMEYCPIKLEVRATIPHLGGRHCPVESESVYDLYNKSDLKVSSGTPVHAKL
jgi:hypothetical protein